MRFVTRFSFWLTTLAVLSANSHWRFLEGAEIPNVYCVFAFDDSVPGAQQDVESMRNFVDLGLKKPNAAQVYNETIQYRSRSFQAGKNEEAKQKILDALRRLTPAPNHVVFFYYSGHGAVDEDTKKYVFAMGKGVILVREEIQAILQEKKCRLAVLISDCCANVTKLEGVRVVPKNDAETLQRNAIDLFIKARGFSNITSSSEGELSWCESPGGFFTRSLWTVMTEKRPDVNQNNVVEWAEIFEETSKATMSRYLKFRTKHLQERSLGPDDLEYLRQQESQTPQAFELAKLDNQANPQVPINLAGIGLQVSTVVAGSPATRIQFKGQQFKLDEGDIILKINGRPLRTVADFENEIRNVRGGDSIRLELSSNGTIYTDVFVKLDANKRLGVQFK